MDNIKEENSEGLIPRNKNYNIEGMEKFRESIPEDSDEVWYKSVNKIISLFISIVSFSIAGVTYYYHYQTDKMINLSPGPEGNFFIQNWLIIGLVILGIGSLIYYFKKNSDN